MWQLFTAIAFVVAATIGAAFALRRAAHVIDAALHDGGAYDTLSQDEVASILEQLGESVEEDSITVAIADGLAYWVDENGLMYAPIDDNDNIDFDLARQYDAFTVPPSELPKVMFILDTIKEGK